MFSYFKRQTDTVYLLFKITLYLFICIKQNYFYSHSNEDPIGQHLNTCVACNTGFGHTGLFEKNYDDHCPGCRYDRGMRRQDSTSSTTSEVVACGSMFVKSEKPKPIKRSQSFFSSTRPTKLASKSLWD